MVNHASSNWSPTREGIDDMNAEDVLNLAGSLFDDVSSPTASTLEKCYNDWLTQDAA